MLRTELWERLREQIHRWARARALSPGGEGPALAREAAEECAQAIARLLNLDPPTDPGILIDAAIRAMQAIVEERAGAATGAHPPPPAALESLSSPGVFDRPPGQVLAVGGAVEALERVHPTAAAVIRARYFAGLNAVEVGWLFGLSVENAENQSRFAKAWVRRALQRHASP